MNKHKKEKLKTEDLKDLKSESIAQDEQPSAEVFAEEKSEAKNVAASKEESLLDELEQLKRENQELKNQYFKAYADADNYKKRTQKELENAMKYRIQSFASELLPTIDNLERALASETSDEAFKNGVEMIYQQLMHLLKKEGVAEIDALNKPFDANFHQALQSEAQEGIEPNTVIAVLQKGYVLKDRILRAALVKVSA